MCAGTRAAGNVGRVRLGGPVQTFEADSESWLGHRKWSGTEHIAQKGHGAVKLVATAITAA
jgi:hypothetical protein